MVKSTPEFERFCEAVREDLERLLSARLSAGDRGDCYGIELLFVADHGPFTCSVEIVAGYEFVLEDDPSDLEKRWNHACLSPDGDVGMVPSTPACEQAVIEWYRSLGVPHGWIDGHHPGADPRASLLAGQVSDGWIEALVTGVQRLHASGRVVELFGRPVPIVISHLVPDKRHAVAAIAANGREIAQSYLDYLATCGVSPVRLAAEFETAERRFLDATG